MAYVDSESDRDALHILPLDTVYLQNESLQQARLIKNPRLESVVELFSGDETGSGQIAPHDLDKTFDFSGDNVRDLELIRSLSALPSYDVYTLRMELGRMGIGVTQASTLNLSDAKCGALAPHMRRYTKPLASAIFGDGATGTINPVDLMAIVANPDPRIARRNLEKLASAADISIPEVPAFLEDYADVLRSATYFQSNANRIEPMMLRFVEEIARIVRDPLLKGQPDLLQACAQVLRRMNAIYSQTLAFLEIFEKKAVQMWRYPSGEQFNSLRSFLENCYVHLGAALCGLSVKLQAWDAISRETSNSRKQAEFVARDMKEGLDRVPLIGQLVGV